MVAPSEDAQYEKCAKLYILRKIELLAFKAERPGVPREFNTNKVVKCVLNYTLMVDLKMKLI